MTRKIKNCTSQVRRALTLLEVLLVFLLLAIASSAIGFKMYGAIEKKKFFSDMERLEDRIIAAQKLALATQMDWSGKLKSDKDGWIFTVRCEEANNKQLKPLKMNKLDIWFNGAQVKNEINFDFFASGRTLPAGNLSFARGKHQYLIRAGS